MTTQLLRPAIPPPDAIAAAGPLAAGASRGSSAGPSLPVAGDVVSVDLPGARPRGGRTVRIRVLQAVWAHHHRRSGPYRKCWIDGRAIDANGVPGERHVLLVRAGAIERTDRPEPSRPAQADARDTRDTRDARDAREAGDTRETGEVRMAGEVRDLGGGAAALGGQR